MNERRLARLKQQIKQRLAQVLQRDIADPKLGLVTITRVEIDTEFSHCKAFWSVIASKDQEDYVRRNSASVLNRARGFCQREMAKVLHTRTVPHLEFHFDEGIGAAIRMNALLRELNDGSAGTAEDTKPTAEDADTESTPAPEPDASNPPESGHPQNDDATANEHRAENKNPDEQPEA